MVHCPPQWELRAASLGGDQDIVNLCHTFVMNSSSLQLRQKPGFCADVHFTSDNFSKGAFSIQIFLACKICWKSCSGFYLCTAWELLLSLMNLQCNWIWCSSFSSIKPVCKTQQCYGCLSPSLPVSWLSFISPKNNNSPCYNGILIHLGSKASQLSIGKCM